MISLKNTGLLAAMPSGMLTRIGSDSVNGDKL